MSKCISKHRSLSAMKVVLALGFFVFLVCGGLLLCVFLFCMVLFVLYIEIHTYPKDLSQYLSPYYMVSGLHHQNRRRVFLMPGLKL